MDSTTFRIVEIFPEPAFTALAEQAFADYGESALLAAVVQEEFAARAVTQANSSSGELRIAAFKNEDLIGWTYVRPEGSAQLYMINSGVRATERRKGIYTELVKKVVAHAHKNGYSTISSRHAANNNSVIIAKLKLGFFVSGFEYSEVYGPLVRLTYIVGELRRQLHHARYHPIRRLSPKHDA